MRGIDIEQYFKFCSYMLISTGFLTLVLTGRVDLFSILLYTLALLLSWRSDSPNSRLQIEQKTANWLAIIFLPFVYLDFRYLSGTFVGPLIHFSLFISIFNLFKRKEHRDWVFLYLIALSEVLFAAILTVDFTFIVMLSVFLLLALATLEAFEIKRSSTDVPIPKDERVVDRLGRQIQRSRIVYLVAVTVVMALLIGLIATPIFLLIPRLNTGVFASQMGTTMVSITGFSDEVEIGEVGSIKKSAEVVMRVKVKAITENLPVGTYRWRGVTLSRYQNGRWTEPRTARRVITKNDGYYRVGQRRDESSPMIEQLFYIEPLNTPTVFAANEPITFDDKLPQLMKNDADAYSTLDHSFKPINYTVYSDIYTPVPEQLRRDELPYSETIVRYYASAANISPRIADLARNITAGATNRYDKAVAIEEYLRRTYGYTLDLSRTDEPDPIVDFLFNIRQGHCEYFASSMVVMLRSQGIAARIVNGFQTGEYNDLGDFYVVRQSDAHSWVEVYFPSLDRWVEFDPTPSAGINRYQEQVLSRFSKYFDAIRMLWIDYVVTYDTQRQSYLASSIQQSFLRYTQNFKTNVRESIMSFYKKFYRRENLLGVVPLLAIGLVLFSLGIALWQFNRMRKGWEFSPSNLFSSSLNRLLLLPFVRWQTRKDAKGSAILFYNEMLDILRRQGYKKRPNQTPLEFAQEMALNEVLQITGVYNKVRYGGATLESSQRIEVQRLLNKLRSWRPERQLADSMRRGTKFLALAILVVLLATGVGFYSFNEYCFDRPFLIYGEAVGYRIPEHTEEIRLLITQVRTSNTDGADYLKNVVLTDTGRMKSAPWEGYLRPIADAERQRIEAYLQESNLGLLEQVAASKTLDTNISSELLLANLEKLGVFGNAGLDELFFWRAYLYLLDGRKQEAEHELGLLLSLGDHLLRCHTLAQTSNGYRIMARAARALARLEILTGSGVGANRWMKATYTFQKELSLIFHIRDGIWRAAESDRNLEAFQSLILKSERMIAREAVEAIGRVWLTNPNRVLLGSSRQRIEMLQWCGGQISLRMVADRELEHISSLGLLKRVWTFRSMFKRRYYKRVDEQLRGF